MKTKKITDVNSTFYFLNYVKLSSSPSEYFDFLKSLNLTQEQYSKLAEIIEDYASERYTEGRFDGIESMQDPY